MRFIGDSFVIPCLTARRCSRFKSVKYSCPMSSVLSDDLIGLLTIADSALAVMIWFGTFAANVGRRLVLASFSLLTPSVQGCALYVWHSPGLSGECRPHKIPFIAEELFASPLGQPNVVAEIVVTKIPQQISAPSLVIFLASTNV